MLLSVHKKCSRLAALGELGRYPLLLSCLKHCLKYEWHLGTLDKDSLVSLAIKEMAAMPDLDTWFSQVQKIKSLFNIPVFSGSKDRVGLKIGHKLHSIYDRYWLDQINATKLGPDGLDHNKLRFYKLLKGSFKQEPYISNILNRSQRTWLTRFRVSAVSNLGIESGRYTRPVTPVTERVCQYCDSNSVDDEYHAILSCTTFTLKRNCFLGRMSSLFPTFSQLTDRDKLVTILCPTTTKMAKTVSKYLGILSETRKKLDNGLSSEMIKTYCKI